jgi:hypothetical protein
MNRNTDKGKICIAVQGYERWKAELTLGPSQTTEDAIRTSLRKVKRQLARQYGVLEGQLEYTRLLGRRSTPQGLVVELEIIRQHLCKGAPVFRLEPVEGPDGTSFSDMVLRVDLFPFDQFDKPLTRESLENYLAMRGIQLDLLDWPVLDKALETLQSTQKEIKGLTAGFGVFPDFGSDAIIEYALPTAEKDRAFAAQIGTRRVARGDLLVRQTPATTGFKMGRNLLGRELVGRRGWEVELVVEEGAKISPDGCNVTAEREGLARFERLEQTIRRQGKVQRIPARIIARVEPLHAVEGNCVLQLDWNGHLEIQGSVLSGSKVRASGAMIVHGDIEKDCEIFARDSIQIDGKIFGSLVESDEHIAAGGASAQTQAKAAKKVLIHGTVEDSCIEGQEVYLGEVKSSRIHALRQAVVEKERASRGDESEIVVNLREFLAHQQIESAATVEKVGETMKRLVQLFGPEVIQTVNSTNMRQVLHQFLRKQKGRGVAPYSPQEIANLRSILELVPAFRDLLADAGQELRELTNQMTVQKDEQLLLVREPSASMANSKSD